MGQYNLLSFCSNNISIEFIDFQKSVGIKEILSVTGTQTWEDVNDDWQNMIFELLERSSKEIAGERFKVNDANSCWPKELIVCFQK